MAHCTISGEVSGKKNGRALSPSHFGKSLAHDARNSSKNALSTPSGLSGVFKGKGVAVRMKRARATRLERCRDR